jgi:sulfur relay (sulfurtransferase) DsrC/TusE family protein
MCMCVDGNSSYVLTTARPPPKKKNWGLLKFTREIYFTNDHGPAIRTRVDEWSRPFAPHLPRIGGT